MKLLTLDPSTTCIGYALSLSGSELLEFGRITPSKAKAPANDRLVWMLTDLRELLAEQKPGMVAIEDTSGHVGGRRHGGGGAGLATYGKSIGAVWQVCAERGFPHMLVPENTWTKNKPKEHRLKRIAMLFPLYSLEADPGGDAGDAIGLAIWWWQRRAEANAMGLGTELSLSESK